MDSNFVPCYFTFQFSFTERVILTPAPSGLTISPLAPGTGPGAALGSFRKSVLERMGPSSHCTDQRPSLHSRTQVQAASATGGSHPGHVTLGGVTTSQGSFPLRRKEQSHTLIREKERERGKQNWVAVSAVLAQQDPRAASRPSTQVTETPGLNRGTRANQSRS